MRQPFPPQAAQQQMFDTAHERHEAPGEDTMPSWNAYGAGQYPQQ